MSGSDVAHLQRELTAKGWTLPITGTYGNTTADLVLTAKKKIKGYPVKIRTRKAGPYFARALAAYKPSTPRSRFVDLLLWGVTNEPKIHYPYHDLNARPVPIDLPIRTLPFTTDCTGIGILFGKWSGVTTLAWPKGSGSGRTSTFVAHCKHI